jgi:hypothetical protein
MKDIYELYIESLKGHKKTSIQSLDQQIAEIALEFSSEEWFLVNDGYGGIQYVDGTDICNLPFIKNVGLYPTRKDKDKPTFGELKAMSFYIRNKAKIEALSDALLRKQKMIFESATSDLAGPEVNLAKLLLEEPKEKAIQMVK